MSKYMEEIERIAKEAAEKEDKKKKEKEKEEKKEEEKEEKKTKNPKKDGSGKGVRANKGRKGCEDNEEEGLGKNAVEKAAEEIMRAMEKIAEEDEEVELSERALRELGLVDALRSEDEDNETKEKDDDDEDEDDKETKEDDNDEEAEEESEDEESKLAQQYFYASLSIEKEAMEAIEEARLMKLASIKVLLENDIIEEKDIEKMAAVTYDDIEKVE